MNRIDAGIAEVQRKTSGNDGAVPFSTSSQKMGGTEDMIDILFFLCIFFLCGLCVSVAAVVGVQLGYHLR
jgi:hypothetical protein